MVHGHPEARVLGGVEERADRRLELVGRDAGERLPGTLQQLLHVGVEVAEPGEVSFDGGLVRLHVAQGGVARCHRLPPMEQQHELGVRRLLAPERSVVVEGRDPATGFHVGRGGVVGHGVDDVEYPLPGRTSRPARQRLLLISGLGHRL